MGATLLPLSALGAIERNGGVDFGVWLPWVSAADGNRVSVKIIHEDDQFIQGVLPREFWLTSSDKAPHGAYWSASVPIAGPAPAGSAWGKPGTYVYRYCVQNPNVGSLDWILDPVSREFGVGKQSAFTLGYQSYAWSAAEAGWRTPALADLVMYELNIAEFGGDLGRAAARLPYLRDLGVNAIEVMPLSNVGGVVDWGYLPIGYFGVDERFGNRADFQRFVDRAHGLGIAVVVDMVYGHTGVDFPYYDLYARLRYDENPFMGPFAKDYFSSFGKSTDFRRALTRDYFHSVTHHWLDVYHVDGIRYDCVPNYWDGPLGDGYSNSVYQAYQLAKAKLGEGAPYWSRFDGGAGEVRLIQCAEQLEAPGEVLSATYSNCTWQNMSFDAAKAVARGDRGRIADWGLQLGPGYCPESVTSNGDTLSKRALQYIENHDHERFVCNFGLGNPDEAASPLFLQGDRRRWYKVQPYLIATFLSRGIPLIWEGQELCENYFLPDYGDGRVALLRPVRWDYFYDEVGRGTVRLVRDILRIRRERAQFRRGEYFFFNAWERYASKGVLAYARWTNEAYSLVVVNTSDEEQWVPFWFPISGAYREELHGGDLDLPQVTANAETWLRIPSNYGRVWSAS
jgi:maltooligosyltrehalose trehalohydrolase